MKRYQRGIRAENLAAWCLRLQGWRILARRYKTPVGEVDLIACRGRRLLAVEVKYRKSGEPLEAVTAHQRGRIQRAMESFLVGNPRFLGYTIQYDVMAMAPRRWPRHVRQAWGS